MKNGKTFRLRFLIMLGVMAVIAIGYFTAFGIGNLSGIGFDSITLLCPLGALLAMIAERTAIPLAVISVIAALIVCIVLGKIFCAWVCPVHFMSLLSPKKKASAHQKADIAPGAVESPTPTMPAIAGADAVPMDPSTSSPDEASSPLTSPTVKRTRSTCTTCPTPCGKTKGIKIDSRHGILAAALGSTLIFGFPVFCLVCPIGLTFASVLLIMRLFAFGETTWTLIVFLLVIVIELAVLPRWCKNFCPLGALLSLMSGLNKTFRPRIDKSKCLKTTQGVDCNLCVTACPEGINLHDIAAGDTTLNDCTKCRACADICPKHAITFPLLPPKRIEERKETETCP